MTMLATSSQVSRVRRHTPPSLPSTSANSAFLKSWSNQRVARSVQTHHPAPSSLQGHESASNVYRTQQWHGFQCSGCCLGKRTSLFRSVAFLNDDRRSAERLRRAHNRPDIAWISNLIENDNRSRTLKNHCKRRRSTRCQPVTRHPGGRYFSREADPVVHVPPARV